MSETWGETFRKFEEDLRRIDQRLASLEQHGRQPRLVTKADVKTHKKTRKRTEGAATTVPANHEDGCTAKRVQDGPRSSISFGVKAEPPALPCRGDVSFGNSAAVPKSSLSLLEMRTPTVAGGLLLAGTASTATRTTFHQPPLRFYSTEDANSKRTSTQDALYHSSFWWNQLPAPSWRRVTQTNSKQTLVFDPGGSKSRLRAYPFLGTRRALLCGEFHVRVLLEEAAAFFGGSMIRESSCRSETGKSLTPYV